MRRALVIGLLSLAELHGYAATRSGQCRFTNLTTRIQVERAVAGAVRRLESPSCQRLFTEFSDGGGAPLRLALDRADATPADFAAQLHFVDGSETPQCTTREELAAFTMPGSRVIFVCGDRFRIRFAEMSKAAEMVIIHEVLHAAGLGENPPSSGEITARVTRRCGA